MKVSYYSFSDYKQIAHQFLAKHGFLSKATLPMDIEALIDKAGITILPVSSMYKDFGVKGAVLKKKEGFDIAIDEQHYEEQEYYFRFTLAEELSHILLHPRLVAGILSLEDVQSFHQSFTDEEYKKIEQQARTLASQLLLPSQIFDDFVLNWVDKNIDHVRSASIYSKADLSEYIADGLYKPLSLSKDVVRFSITRFPEPAIDKVLADFGITLIR